MSSVFLLEELKTYAANLLLVQNYPHRRGIIEMFQPKPNLMELIKNTQNYDKLIFSIVTEGYHCPIVSGPEFSPFPSLARLA